MYKRQLYTSYSSTCSSSKVCDASRWNYVHILPSEHPGTWYTSRNNISMHLGIISSNNASAVLLPLLLCCCCKKYATRFSAFFVTPTLPALSRVPPAVCPSLLESATTACTSFLQSLFTYVHTPTPHSILRFRPAPQTADLHTSNLPLLFERSEFLIATCEKKKN